MFNVLGEYMSLTYLGPFKTRLDVKKREKFTDTGSNKIEESNEKKMRRPMGTY